MQPLNAQPLEDWAGPRRAALDTLLSELFSDAWPEPFGAMGRYPLLTGGKRIRPLLCLAAHEAVTGTWEPALRPAAAIEMVHCYSLVHDDMPCMDDDAERRGKPTTHIQFGEDMALLVGDALLTESFRILSRPWGDPAMQLELVRELSTAAGYHGMIGGQAADLGALGDITDVETLTRLHRGKTGALIRCAVRMGAITARADWEVLDGLTRYANHVGLAFQLADDVLDEEQDAGDDGPPSFVKLLGVDETRRRAQALAQEALDALGALEAPVLRQLAHFSVERTI
jgi:geranylgeranyl pyrophosphate synthase